MTEEAHFAIVGDEELAFSLAAWVTEQRALGITTPLIDGPTVAEMRARPPPTMKKRAELYLGAVIRLLGGKLKGSFSPYDLKLRVASWTPDPDDCQAIAKYLEDQGALQPPSAATLAMVLVPKGHMIYEEMVEQRAPSSQAFVAMWFDDKVKAAFTSGIEPAIRGAGYEPVRVDRTDHTDKIDDRIIAEIRRSAFLVGDFTGHRGGVYYEAGFAHGLGRKVVFTCRADDLKNLHFDVRQYNTISWNTPADLIAPLQNRILALFGPGPLKPDAKPIPVD